MPLIKLKIELAREAAEVAVSFASRANRIAESVRKGEKRVAEEFLPEEEAAYRLYSRWLLEKD